MANSDVPELFELRPTFSKVVDRLPNWSYSVTVICPSVAVADATPETGVDVIFSVVATPGTIVSCWVALMSPFADAVIVGVPSLASP